MATQQKSTSVPPPSNSRRSFSDRISAVGAKINRALSNDGGPQNDGDTASLASTLVEGSVRSVSRGRELSHSSGRGGIGNFHPTSNSISPPPAVPDEFPWPRGRERTPAFRPQDQARSTGRGGSGNFSHSPQTPSSGNASHEREILRARAEADKNAVRSSGRGGAGNMINPARSRSLDPSLSMSAVHVQVPGYSASPDRNGVVNGDRGKGT
ncbi:hypothetical protein B0H10DRAFT_2105565 [Mycena sp. CBHHK59/15]|nr:hypothetical protein B0H10DRAFT_2105565 [Mycena sp. CBHHK59/15]